MRQNLHHPLPYERRLRHCLLNSTITRAVALSVIGLMAGSVNGCGELEPMVEPEMVDLQLTVDTLKTQVRDAQRSLTELRVELESRRQELADAQVARAQLEGRVREAERRVAEARHVIELQREELIAARIERERVFRSSSQLQNQLRQLQKKAPKLRNPAGNDQDGVPAPAGASMRKGQRAVVVPSISEVPPASAQSAKVQATPAAMKQDIPANDPSIERRSDASPAGHISVKPGDTLWSIARKYRIDLNRLRSLNHLPDNQIKAGQALRISESRTAPDLSVERTEPRP